MRPIEISLVLNRDQYDKSKKILLRRSSHYVRYVPIKGICLHDVEPDRLGELGQDYVLNFPF